MNSLIQKRPAFMKTRRRIRHVVLRPHHWLLLLSACVHSFWSCATRANKMTCHVGFKQCFIESVCFLPVRHRIAPSVTFQSEKMDEMGHDGSDGGCFEKPWICFQFKWTRPRADLNFIKETTRLAKQSNKCLLGHFLHVVWTSVTQQSHIEVYFILFIHYALHSGALIVNQRNKLFNTNSPCWRSKCCPLNSFI